MDLVQFQKQIHHRDTEHTEKLFFAGPGDDGPTNVSALRAASLARFHICHLSPIDSCFSFAVVSRQRKRIIQPLCPLCLERSGW